MGDGKWVKMVDIGQQRVTIQMCHIPNASEAKKKPSMEPKTCQKGPKVGSEYWPTFKTSHCVRTACMAFPLKGVKPSQPGPQRKTTPKGQGDELRPTLRTSSRNVADRTAQWHHEQAPHLLRTRLLQCQPSCPPNQTHSSTHGGFPLQKVTKHVLHPEKPNGILTQPLLHPHPPLCNPTLCFFFF